ncbi:MAG TPA: hypothetical protein VGK74_19120 [Symbiobacteriaceae bacterium]|jgi:hypothetical protein
MNKTLKLPERLEKAPVSPQVAEIMKQIEALEERYLQAKGHDRVSLPLEYLRLKEALADGRTAVHPAP